MSQYPPPPPGGNPPPPPGGPPPPPGGYGPPPPGGPPPPQPGGYGPPPQPGGYGQPPQPGGYPAPPPPGGFAPPPPPQGGMMPPPPPPGGFAPPPGGYQMQQGMGVRYGGFWIRLVSYIIDALLLGIPFAILNSVAAQTGSSALSLIFSLAEVVIGVGYFIYMWGSRGQTVGMMPFKLFVRDANTGGPITMGKAGIRYVGFLVSAVICYIGFIIAAFDARKQGLHDKIAGTVVVQEG